MKIISEINKLFMINVTDQCLQIPISFLEAAILCCKPSNLHTVVLILSTKEFECVSS